MRYFTWLVRIPFLFSALWSIGVGLYLLLTPQIILEQVAVSTPGGTEASGEIIRQEVSWYQVQGLWGVIVLVIFAMLFILIGIFVVRQRLIAAAITSLLAVILVFLAGLSIGPLYLPAVLGVAVGWAISGLTRLLGGKENTPD